MINEPVNLENCNLNISTATEKVESSYAVGLYANGYQILQLSGQKRSCQLIKTDVVIKD